MDIVVIVLVLGALAVMIFKRFNYLVYYVGIVDIFLRVLTFIANNIQIKVVSEFVNKYFPNSITSIMNSYSSGIINTVLQWLLVIIYIFLIYYLVKIFLKKK